MTIQELEVQIKHLDALEKTRLYYRLIFDLSQTWPGIEKSPGICGGDARIVRTRIPVWALENFRRLGSTDAELLENYPTLVPTDLINAWAYVETHRDDVASAIQENELWQPESTRRLLTTNRWPESWFA